MFGLRDTKETSKMFASSLIFRHQKFMLSQCQVFERLAWSVLVDGKGEQSSFAIDATNQCALLAVIKCAVTAKYASKCTRYMYCQLERLRIW